MLKGLNRAALIAILPLMALGIVSLTKLTGGVTAPPPADGTIVVANLRGESLSLIDIAVPENGRTLALAGPPHEMLATAGRIYATLGRGNAVIEVEPRTPAILRTLSLAGEPHGLTLCDGSLIVSLDAADALVTLDRAAFTERFRQGTGDTPHTVTASGEGCGSPGATAYVTNSRDNTVARLGATPATAPTGRQPESVVRVSGLLITADALDGTLSVFREDTLELLGRIPVGREPVRVFAIDERHLAVSLAGEARLAIVSLTTMKVERRLKTLDRPDGICLSPDGKYLAVVSNADDAVQVFRVSDWRTAAAYPAGDGPGSCLWL
jgi:hypothetical protein